MKKLFIMFFLAAFTGMGSFTQNAVAAGSEKEKVKTVIDQFAQF